MIRASLPALLCLAVALPDRSAAAGPRDELLRLVPPDTAFCFVVQGLRDQAKTVGDSPFAAWASEKIGPNLAGTAEFVVIKQFEKLIGDQIGVTLADLRDDILGDAVVLAYQPGPPGKPDAEHGAVMLKARSPEKLRKLLARLNEVQTERGEITAVKEVSHRGAAYTRRVKADGKDEFYLVRDGLFVFSGQETAIKEVIELAAAPPGAAAPVAASLKRLGIEDAFLTCWINPRRLDADLTAHAAAATDAGHRAFLGRFAEVWAAIDGLAIYLDVRKEAELGLAVTFDPKLLPAEVRPLLSSPPTRSAVWQRVPDDALFAAGGRVDTTALLAAVASFVPAEERDAVRGAVEKAIGPVVGKHNLPAVLTGIGPDWGVWVSPPAAGAKTWVPGWTAAVRVRGSDGDTARRGVRKVVGFWANMLVYDYNQKHDDQIESRDEDGITTLTNDAVFPPGFRPSYAVKDGFLVLGGSPEAVRRFAAPTQSEVTSAEAPFLRVSGSALRAYLLTHKAELGKWLAGVQDRPAEEVVKEIGKLADVMEPVDRVELLVRGDERRIGLAVRVRLVKPLSK